MCLIGFAFQCHRDRPLIVAANRDEYMARPTQAAAWWADQPHIFGGRDLQSGGSWMAASRHGRLVALTNFRGSAGPANPPTRGRIVQAALTDERPVDAFLHELSRHAADYAGFNLLVFDWQRESSSEPPSVKAWHLSNRINGTLGVDWHPLKAGVHALSNGPIESTWPKAVALKQAITASLSATPATRRGDLLSSLTSEQPAPSHLMPTTGIPVESERSLSPQFIRAQFGKAYGTRSSALIELDRQARLHYEEISWHDSGPQCHQRRISVFPSAHLL